MQAIRELVPGAAGFVARHKVPLSLFSTANLAFIVWQVLSSAQSVCECRCGLDHSRTEKLCAGGLDCFIAVPGCPPLPLPP